MGDDLDEILELEGAWRMCLRQGHIPVLITNGRRVCLSCLDEVD